MEGRINQVTGSAGSTPPKVRVFAVLHWNEVHEKASSLLVVEQLKHRHRPYDITVRNSWIFVFYRRTTYRVFRLRLRPGVKAMGGTDTKGLFSLTSGSGRSLTTACSVGEVSFSASIVMGSLGRFVLRLSSRGIVQSPDNIGSVEECSSSL
jgi:hypothetical protein